MAKFNKVSWTEADVRCPFYLGDDRRDRSIRCEGYRWCDVRYDSEIEYEHMRRKGRNSHLYEDRSRNCRHDDVCCRCGNTHTDDDACDHGEEESEECAVFRDSEEKTYECLTKTCERYNADYNA